MGGDDRTETATPNAAVATLPAVAGVVALFTEGRPAVSRPLGVRAAVRIGHSDEADLVLLDTKASRLHAELEPAAGGILVTEGSRNGVSVDGCRIEGPKTFAPIGAVLRIGNTLLEVVADVMGFAHEAGCGDDLLLGGPALAPVRRRIAQAGPTDLAVLVEGESGTGKELVARAVHRASGRRGQLVGVNCAALPGELIEAELFGHARGAFSSADAARRGLVRSADGGTLFLDEIGEMGAGTQAKLLRVLEDKQVRPVGEDHATAVDVRVVAATNRDLEARIAEGAFREDLFHRLATVRLRLPPLRARREDVPLLVQHFLAPDAPRPSVEAMELLMLWRWPGNVRELCNAVVSAANEAGGAPFFGAEHLPAALREGPGEPDADAALRRRLSEALARADGNVTEAARALGVRRAGIYEQLKRLGIDPDAFRR
jgi:DNA-binding NtrC family response regulator